MKIIKVQQDNIEIIHWMQYLIKHPTLEGKGF